MTCGAKTRSGKPCQKPPLQGKNRCRLHGGASLCGVDHPNYKHGNCTKAARNRSADVSAYVKYLKHLAIGLGMLPTNRR